MAELKCRKCRRAFDNENNVAAHERACKAVVSQNIGTLFQRANAAAAATAAAAASEAASAATGGVAALVVAAEAAPAPAASPPPDAPQPGGLGELDLQGLLMHPHLGVLVLEYLGNDTRAATALRGTCRGARDAVAVHRWHDMRAVARIRWPRRWRAAFPAATAANVSRERDGPPSTLTDADFLHFRGVRTLNMRYCNQATITDAAFAHLVGIHTLNMSHCEQATITDGAFAHLAGIHTLNMSGCWQKTITDGAFAHLAGIHTLDMSFCIQVTDSALAHLAGIRELDVLTCPRLTDAAFAQLAGATVRR